MEDPDTELSFVICKNAERAELESYLRGLRFAINSKSDRLSGQFDQNWDFCLDAARASLVSDWRKLPLNKGITDSVVQDGIAVLHTNYGEVTVLTDPGFHAYRHLRIILHVVSDFVGDHRIHAILQTR